MSKYHKRVLTYDDKTQMYKVSVPELGIEVQSDTEMSALLDARDEVARAAQRPQSKPMPTIQDGFWDQLDLTVPVGGFGIPSVPYHLPQKSLAKPASTSTPVGSLVGSKIRILQDNLDFAPVLVNDIFVVVSEIKNAIFIKQGYSFFKHHQGTGFEVLP